MFISVPRLWLKFQQGVQQTPPAKLNLLLSLPLIGGFLARRKF